MKYHRGGSLNNTQYIFGSIVSASLKNFLCSAVGQGFSHDKFTDDQVTRKLPTIRRSRYFLYLPTIRRSRYLFVYRRSYDHDLGFLAESYRRSDDPNSDFLPKVTDDLTITIRFFCRKLPTIRRSHLAFFCESYRRSDDQIPVFLPNVTLPTIRRSHFGFFAERYRRSDDHFSVFFR